MVAEAEFDAATWYGILQSERVTVWYTAPTAIRMMMKLGVEAVRGYDLSALRFLASVGEPLNPEAVVWGQQAFGRPFHDNWWQTETGGIMIANFAAMDVKPGSMGKPLPGIDAAIVQRNADGSVTPIEQPMVEGELALRAGWPSMMRGYLNEEARYRKCFVGDWYLTGDLAMRDADGYYWFVGRADDVIKSSGHLIGPFEVESALMEHPAVAEAGVIGKPDPMAGEIVKAFVALKPGFTASEALRRDLLGHARKHVGRGGGAEGDRFQPRPAAHPQRQDHAPAAEGARTRLAGRRSVHAGKRRAMNDKVHLDHTHVRHLLTAMLRIRRFEEKCFELYTTEKIRGFMHLYDGEEAVSVGVIAGAAAAGRHRRHLSRARPGAGARHRHGPADGGDVRQAGRVLPRPRRLDARVRPRRSLLWRQRHRRRRTAARGRRRAWRTRCWTPDAVTACFFGEGAVDEGSFHESMNLAALWQLPVLFVCENNRYSMGMALERAEAETEHRAQGRRLPHRQRGGGRHGCGRGGGRRPAR